MATLTTHHSISTTPSSTPMRYLPSEELQISLLTDESALRLRAALKGYFLAVLAVLVSIPGGSNRALIPGIIRHGVLDLHLHLHLCVPRFAFPLVLIWFFWYPLLRCLVFLLYYYAVMWRRVEFFGLRSHSSRKGLIFLQVFWS